MRGAARNNCFVDIRIDRDFFAKMSSPSIWTAGLQVDGHADHNGGYMVLHRLSVAQFQIGIFSDAPVLHADIQTKRAVFLRYATTQ